ncbi:hypothetical protein HWV07_18780 [Natronomonas salina]|uniref:hypothetical protein n=1 Tax=Natronomonas salina TaxID=1710540 RepID=UPI0015B5FFA9|nr:hypothetical protein [Natronomonas salina]QLD90980.1 hypothetical protein HWV07_18780 [Natronomonas salina]
MNTDYELRERIEAVSDAEGDEDDPLTVAIPPEASVGETLERVEEDHAEAEYIDSDESSTDRRAVLDRARQLLHDYDETPENGLVLHVGAVEYEDDVVEYVFDDLPGRVAEPTFEWDNEFDVERAGGRRGGRRATGDRARRPLRRDVRRRGNAPVPHRVRRPAVTPRGPAGGHPPFSASAASAEA